MKESQHFDFDKKPLKGRKYLKPLEYLLSFPETIKRRLKVNKVNMHNLKPPYILLCSHHAFIDFKVTTRAIFPHQANYIVAIDGFIGREWLLRSVGGICKRKFTNDIRLIKQIKYSLETLKNIVAIYPEARYSLIGTTAILPESLGKIIKMMNKPVVVLNMHGNYLSQPVWNLKKRKTILQADMTQIIEAKDIANLSVNKINELITVAFQYDEYNWQYQNNIKIKYKNRAKNLHKVLYQCPNCLVEHKMDSDKHYIWCNACNKKYEMNENGRLNALGGITEFPHIPDWYEFERIQVRKQIDEGKYCFQDMVRIESLPNSKGYINLGEGTLVHNEHGFILLGQDPSTTLKLVLEPLALYSLHIEYDYFKKGDCIDLSTINDTYYIYPLTKQNVVTKLHFAVEELYKIEKAKITKASSV